jgi:hypothetical protein
MWVCNCCLPDGLRALQELDVTVTARHWNQVGYLPAVRRAVHTPLVHTGRLDSTAPWTPLADQAQMSWVPWLLKD